MYNTLLESGFVTEILATPGEESTRNLIFLASYKEKDFSLINYSEPNYSKIDNLYDFLLDPKEIDLSDAHILSDKKPLLSKLYTKASKKWKKSYNDYYRSYFMK